MAISSTAFASISSGTTTSAGSALSGYLSASKSDGSDKGYSTDEVSISQEAMELAAELLAQRKAKVKSANNKEADDFASVAKGLPASQTFNDMVEWVATWSGGSVNETDAPDRDAYKKNVKKYVTMWKNLYENYMDTMKDLGLNPEYSAHRTALHQSNISSKVQHFFTENLDKETKGLMKMFNITI